MGHTAEVLLVDDDDEARGFLYELLAAADYRVTTCADGYEALRSIARRKPDLVICDVHMPEIDGIELLAKIRHLSPATRLIVYTAYGNWSMFLESLERGAVDLIPKGASNAEILSVVRNALEGVPR